MNPDQFPNPNGVDDGMPMFGGNCTRWPGQEDYRVKTPGSVGSTFDSEAEFDLFFNTDSYRVDEIESSCGQPSALEPRPTAKSARKKRMARKDKDPAVPLPSEEINNEYALRHTDYSMEEYMKVAKSWIDISEDPIWANNQTMARTWDRIEARYNSVTLKWAYKQNKKPLCKCWDIYTKMKDDRGSGESMEDVLHKSLLAY